MRHIRPFWGGLLLLLVVLTWSVRMYHMPSQWLATKRIVGFNQAINENNPADIYSYLMPELKEMLTKEEFIRNFNKERSYPYLTPLFVYLDEVKLSSDLRSGEAISTVAARLPGEKMKVRLTYIEGKYYIDAFRDIVDGSYLLKFHKLGN